MFNEDVFYKPDDEALRPIGAISTLAHWRIEGRGPRFYKIGNRVIYSGRDLNAWLERQAHSQEAA